MKLTEILSYLDFDFNIKDNKFHLVDILGANLAQIENEEYEINDNLPMVILDRLDVYLNDYFYTDILDYLGYSETESFTWLELLDKLYDDDYYSRYTKEMLFYLEYPKLLDIQDIKEAQRSQQDER